MLTILLPNYNYFEGYKKNLYQIMIQSRRDSEEIRVVISDDSTNNNIEKDVKVNYQQYKNIEYFRGPQLGAVPNWNKCIKLSGSTYSMILHHDEYMVA